MVEQLIIYGLLVTVIAMLQVRKIATTIKLLAFQSFLLTVLSLLTAFKTETWSLLFTSGLTLTVKTIAIPYILHYTINRININRGLEPFLNRQYTFLISLILLIVSYYVTANLHLPGEDQVREFLPVAVSLIFIGAFIMIIHRKAIVQGIGLITIENGLFLLTMLLVMLFNNLALVWIAIELTTLISALLIAFYRKPSAFEAAWKYFIIGSLGIAFGLFGILFLFASGFDVIDETANSFNWTVLYEFAKELDPTWMSIAFVFVLVGYGTKAGLAPLHFWLPDAHSEAPSPISAILSGVLLNTALYGMLRVYLIANETLMGSASNWLLFFGLFSVVLMVPFIIV